MYHTEASRKTDAALNINSSSRTLADEILSDLQRVEHKTGMAYTTWYAAELEEEC